MRGKKAKAIRRMIYRELGIGYRGRSYAGVNVRSYKTEAKNDGERENFIKTGLKVIQEAIGDVSKGWFEFTRCTLVADQPRQQYQHLKKFFLLQPWTLRKCFK